MGNLMVAKTITGEAILTGVVTKIEEQGFRIKNCLYDNGKAREVEVYIMYSGCDKDVVKPGAKIYVLADISGKVIKGLKATEKPFKWKIGNHTIVIRSRFKLIKCEERYSRIKAELDGKTEFVSFWNDTGNPTGKRIEQVFGSGREIDTAVVCNASESNGKTFYNGHYFMCN